MLVTRKESREGVRLDQRSSLGLTDVEQTQNLGVGGDTRSLVRSPLTLVVSL